MVVSQVLDALAWVASVVGSAQYQLYESTALALEGVASVTAGLKPPEYSLSGVDPLLLVVFVLTSFNVLLLSVVLALIRRDERPEALKLIESLVKEAKAVDERLVDLVSEASKRVEGLRDEVGELKNLVGEVKASLGNLRGAGPPGPSRDQEESVDDVQQETPLLERGEEQEGAPLTQGSERAPDAGFTKGLSELREELNKLVGVIKRGQD